MDTNFWQDRWRAGQIGFHQKDVNDLLCRHWPALRLPNGSQVFVPLAGKSLDMAWLAGEGHRVIGNEISELAVDAFLSSQGLVAAESYSGLHVVKRAHGFELWLGDYFALPAPALRHIAGVFDRAALIAMPRTLQPIYAEKLAQLTPPGAMVLLITIEYDPSEMSGPPFSVPGEQVRALFTGHFDITEVDKRDGMPKSENLKARGLSRLAEVVYLMTRKAV